MAAITFAARRGIQTLGADLYCTHSPCYECARGIVNSGIKSVVYGDVYRSTDGLKLLREAGVRVSGIKWYGV